MSSHRRPVRRPAGGGRRNRRQVFESFARIAIAGDSRPAATPKKALAQRADGLEKPRRTRPRNRRFTPGIAANRRRSTRFSGPRGGARRPAGTSPDPPVPRPLAGPRAARARSCKFLQGGWAESSGERLGPWVRGDGNPLPAADRAGIYPDARPLRRRGSGLRGLDELRPKSGQGRGGRGGDAGGGASGNSRHPGQVPSPGGFGASGEIRVGGRAGTRSASPAAVPQFHGKPVAQ